MSRLYIDITEPSKDRLRVHALSLSNGVVRSPGIPHELSPIDVASQRRKLSSDIKTLMLAKRDGILTARRNVVTANARLQNTFVSRFIEEPDHRHLKGVYLVSERPLLFSCYSESDDLWFVNRSRSGKSPNANSAPSSIGIIAQDDLRIEGKNIFDFIDQAHALQSLFRQHGIADVEIYPGGKEVFSQAFADCRIVVFLGHPDLSEDIHIPNGLLLRENQKERLSKSYRDLAREFGVSIDPQTGRCTGPLRQPLLVPELLVIPSCLSSVAANGNSSIPEMWQAIGVKWFVGSWTRLWTEEKEDHKSELAETINEFVVALVKAYREFGDRHFPRSFRQAQTRIGQSRLWPGVFQLYTSDDIVATDVPALPAEERVEPPHHAADPRLIAVSLLLAVAVLLLAVVVAVVVAVMLAWRLQ